MMLSWQTGCRLISPALIRVMVAIPISIVVRCALRSGRPLRSHRPCRWGGVASGHK